MSIALSAGVSGLQAHQKMLDIAGNNLANVNTTGYKSSSINFSDTLSQTIKNATGPTGGVGGTNPQQLGTGVQIASVTRNMNKGNITATGQDLDMAIDGNGFFVVSNGEDICYTRIGSFTVDPDNNLIDKSTGYKVQRIGNAGEAEGFQSVGNSNIKIPYNTSIPPKETTSFAVTGNLRAAGSASEQSATKLEMRLGMVFTLPNGEPANETTKLSELSQFNGGTWMGSESISINGKQADGSAVSMADLSVDANTTIQDVLDYINNAPSPFDGELTASLENGEIYVRADSEGYNKSDIAFDFNSAGGANIDLPGYFKIEVPAANDIANTNITIFDSQGGEHVVSASFVRTDTPRKWDLVLTSVTGDVNALTDRRIEGIDFTNSGEYDGLDGLDPNGESFLIDFAHDPGMSQKITVDMGTKGQLDGITQFPSEGVDSTVAADKADGYAMGKLSSVTVSSDGTLIGTFTNGAKKNIASIELAIFQNPQGLEAVGNGYYVATANSGTAVSTQASFNGAGELVAKSLEKSNVDTAVEFVKLIEAQNGFQANARTIQVANDVLKELTNLIR